MRQYAIKDVLSRWFFHHLKFFIFTKKVVNFYLRKKKREKRFKLKNQQSLETKISEKKEKKKNLESFGKLKTLCHEIYYFHHPQLPPSLKERLANEAFQGHCFPSFFLLNIETTHTHRSFFCFIILSI